MTETRVGPSLDQLQRRIGYRFADPEALRRALVHTSYVNEVAEPKPQSNERLEFLGDAVLELVVAERLFLDRPELAEGDLTTMRAALVRLETLGRVGLGLGLGGYLFLGRGEESTGGRGRPTVVGRALEALIGAVYFDGGLSAARDVALRLIGPEIERVAMAVALKDDKSRLQEAAQGELGLTPSYRTVAAVGPDHAKEFTVEVSLGDVVVGRGDGRTKQLAAQEAARDALGRWPPPELRRP
ncbi:MAG TPA: ribonuclease III [Chloroflexota bacterium]|jgi:ribonuclease-3|nr:ribonuclease III [Chloroflexota bacterium]